MYKNKNYIELNAAYEVYKSRFYKLLSLLTAAYIKNYTKMQKTMPISVAHFLAYTTINKLIQQKWFDENLDFVDLNFLNKNI